MNNNYFNYLWVVFFILTILNGNAQIRSQKIGNNPTLISSSAVLEVESSNRGVLIPRVALTGTLDVTTISSPATSLLVYNTATAGTSPNNVKPGFYYWNGTSWIIMSTGDAILTEVDGIIGNEIVDAVANGGLTRTGSGTASDPFKLQINEGTAAGQVLVWNGTRWVIQAMPAEVDGVIGNEVTDAVIDGGLTRLGTGSTLDPYRLKINDGTATGQTMVWNGTKWVTQAQVPAWNLSGNSGTNPSVNFIGTTDARDLVFDTNSIERMRITSSGNIGIGSNSPASNLDVIGAMALRNVAGGYGTNYGIEFNTSASTPRIDWVYNGFYTGSLSGDPDFFFRLQNSRLGVGGFRFMTNPSGSGVERFTILNNGNIGIGSTSPNGQLQFGNTLSNRKIVLFESSNNDHQFYGFGINNSGVGIFRHQIDNSAASFGWYAATSATSSNELMRLTGTGRLGIGTTSPNGTIQFNNADIKRRIVLWEDDNNDHQFIGIGMIPSLFNFQLNSNGSNFSWSAAQSASSSNELMRLTGTGRLGIGTNNPLNNLHIVNSGSTSGMTNMFGRGIALTNSGGSRIYFEDTAANTNQKVFQINGEGGFLHFNALTDNASQFSPIVSAPAILSLKSSTNFVGIGKNDPVSRLDVNGSLGLSILSTSTSLTLNDTHSVVRVNTSIGNVTLTLPSPSTAINRVYFIHKTDATNNKIIFSTPITANGYTFSETNLPGEYRLHSDGTFWYLVN